MAENRDLVLVKGQFALALDNTKGAITVYMGPTTEALTGTFTPITYDEGSYIHRECEIEDCIQQCIVLTSTQYAVLGNPVKEGKVHPEETTSKIPDLNIGSRVIINGPASFALWPGQTVVVVDGHGLQTNHYLTCKVYDAAAAQKNWQKAIIQPQVEIPADGEDAETTQKPPETKTEKLVFGGITDPSKIVMGQKIIIRGTDVSFFIPPTGIEVVISKSKEYIRKAVTLECLEYCILLDENGSKSYPQGPDVVFPTPTQRYQVGNGEKGSRRFKAMELTETSGIYVKVIEAYEEEVTVNSKPEKVQRTVGEELFITGKDGDSRIYFPRPEHAIVRQGDSDVMFACALPEGSAMYLLDRRDGKIELVKGPAMLLPDPRTHVICRRVLTQREVDLYFPGNAEAQAFNDSLREKVAATSVDGAPSMYVSSHMSDNFLGDDDDHGHSPLGLMKGLGPQSKVGHSRSFTSNRQSDVIRQKDRYENVQTEFGGDTVNRKTSYTPLRDVLLDPRFQGAVRIEPYNGYAVLVTSKSGNRRVVQGPTPAFLAFDEGLEVIKLSTGTPKNVDRSIETVYLKTQNNMISDEVVVETIDLVELTLRLTYHVNFTGEKPDLWFNAENPIQLLTERTRSMLRRLAKLHTVEEFYAKSVDLIRTTILGEKSTGKDNVKRTGLLFEENNMLIYDMDVLKVRIDDEEIEEMITEAQSAAVKSSIAISSAKRESDATTKLEGYKRDKSVQTQLTATSDHKAKLADVDRENKEKLANLKVISDGEKAVQDAKLTIASEKQVADDKLEAGKLTAEKGRQKDIDDIAKAKLTRQTNDDTQVAASKGALAKIGTENFVARLGAVDADFAETLHKVVNSETLGKIAESMGPVAMFTKTGVLEVIGQLLAGSSLSDAAALKGLLNDFGN